MAVDAAGVLVWHHLEPTEPLMAEQGERLLSLARERAGATETTPLVTTGYGRKLIGGATRSVTEITCHATGVFRALGRGGTLVDIGGQDSKVIVIGAGGAVVDFAMNDKCAAGTGRFLEVTAGRLRIPLEELGGVALGTSEEVTISSTCTVFAESEIISLLAAGAGLAPIVRGLFRALIGRVATLARSVGVRSPVLLSGGVARSGAARAILAAELGETVEVPANPQLMGAYGAALLALRG